jgi:hypothetical protein
MEKLIKQKENIERELESSKEEYSKFLFEEQEAKYKIEELKKRLINLKNNYNSIKETLKQKKDIFIQLKSKIRKYKEHKNNEILEIYRTKYNKIILSINNVQCKYNLQIFDSFGKYNEILNGIEGFPNLKSQLKIFLTNKKEDLKNLIMSDIVDNKEIHKIIYLLKFVRQYEIFFNEELLYTCLNNFINKRYEYHFLTDKETNRLDKAEWIFNYLEKKIDETYKFIEIYENISNKDSENSIKNTNKALKGLKMKKILKNVVKLINKKIVEIGEIESKQKRDILINFNYFLSVFIIKINKKYEINLDESFKDFKDELIEQEKDQIILKLQNIHKQNYKEWFIYYEELLKECLNLNRKHLKINIEFPVDNLLEYNLIFIDSMRYINRKEIQVLLLLFNKFEDFKEYLVFLFEETKQEDTALEVVNGSNTKIEYGEESIHGDNILMKISRFNLENFKLIKTLFENDIQNVLNLKFYFVSDLYNILEEYKCCKGFSKLKKMASEMIDNYLTDSILLSRKLDKTEYLDLLSLFRKLKALFDIKHWESREVMKCIKGIFEKKKVENKYTKEICKMYLQ